MKTEQWIAAILGMAGFIGVLYRLGSMVLTRLLDSYIEQNKDQQKLFSEHVQAQTMAIVKVSESLQRHDELSCQAHITQNVCLAGITETLGRINGYKKPKRGESSG